MADTAGDPLPTVALPSAGVEHSFNYLCLTLNSTTRIQIVAVAYIDDRLLVAAPHTAWHKRTAAKRVLPALVKPVLVEVGCVEEERRSQLLPDQTMKLWMGFLPPELVAQLSQEEEDVEYAHVFSDSDFESFYPSGASLVAAASEHFAFQSATGGEEDPPVDYGSHAMESRLGRLENLVGSLAAKLDSVLVPQEVAGVPLQSGRPSALRKPSRARDKSSAPHVSFPSLDPSVVASALSAGVDVTSLQEMERLMQEPTVKGKKIAEPMGARAKPSPAPKKAQSVNVLSETDSDEEEQKESGGSGAVTPGGSQPSMEDAVSQLAQIVQVLTSDKMKKHKASKVETALDGVSASGVTETGSIGSGKRTAAARRALRAALVENPEEIAALIERLMMEDLSSQTVTPGQPVPSLCAKAWVEHRSRIGHWKSSAYTAWTVAAALDALRSGNVPGCRARLNLMLLMLDQTACDRGSWTLSSELSLEQPPPMSVLQTHSPPSIQDGELPFSRLLDPRWAEVAMSHVRDTEEYISRRSKLGRKDPAGDADPAPKPKPKAKVKGGASQSNPQLTES